MIEKITHNPLMRFVAEHGNRPTLQEQAGLAHPNQIGKVVSETAKKADDENPNELTFLQLALESKIILLMMSLMR